MKLDVNRQYEYGLGRMNVDIVWDAERAKMRKANTSLQNKHTLRHTNIQKAAREKKNWNKVQKLTNAECRFNE